MNNCFIRITWVLGVKSLKRQNFKPKLNAQAILKNELGDYLRSLGNYNTTLYL